MKIVNDLNVLLTFEIAGKKIKDFV